MRREPYSYRADPDVPAFRDDAPLFVFDGHCLLCSGAASFILAHDRRGRIRFTPAQSALGAALYRHYGLKTGDYETNILIENGRALLKSDSSIRIFELIGGPWSLLALGRLLPRFLRDPLYKLIARNRLKWFGARETCYLPAPAERERFIL